MTGGPDNPRAYPSAPIDDKYGGMSLRDAFALAALPALVSRIDFALPETGRGVAQMAYNIADTMLVERNRERP